MHLGFAGGIFQTADELDDAGEGEAVKNLLAAFFVRDNARFAEGGQMMRNRGPAEAAAADQIGDAFLGSVVEFPDNAEPGFRSECPEDFHG